MKNKSFPFSILFSSTLLALTCVSCACSDNRRPEVRQQKNGGEKGGEVALLSDVESPTEGASKVSVNNLSFSKAVAHIHPYQDHKISGLVTFTKVPEGILIVADVDGLKPGKHGFHVHEHGDCGGTDGMKAGGHFNPTHTKHGGPDSAERHVGDFGNLDADRNGHAHYERVDTLIAFEGENSILERSIIIHADPDDLVSQPTGNSGPRIACGKVEAVIDVTQ